MRVERLTQGALAGRDRLTEQFLEQAGQGRRVAVFQFEDFDLGFGLGKLIQLPDELRHQVHPVARPANQQGVHVGIGRDHHVRQDAGLDQSVAGPVNTQDRDVGRPAGGFRPRGADARLTALAALLLVGRRARNGFLQHGDQIVGQRVLQTEHA